MKTITKTIGFRSAKAECKKVPKAIYTIQYNTIRGGFGSSNQNQNHPYVLVALTNKKVFLSCFFFLFTLRKNHTAKTSFACLHKFSTDLSTIEKNEVQNV